MSQESAELLVEAADLLCSLSSEEAAEAELLEELERLGEAVLVVDRLGELDRCQTAG